MRTVLDQYLLRRRDGSLELWVTDGLGLSRCSHLWLWPTQITHSFEARRAWTTVENLDGRRHLIPGFAPEAHEDGHDRCCHYGCQ